jgi:hypothetical protein
MRFGRVPCQLLTLVVALAACSEPDLKVLLLGIDRAKITT